MPAIASISGRGVPVRGNDIDTDRIIPARYLRCVTFEGLGAHAFADDRSQLRAAGKLHAFDDPRFVGARVLVANANFGCGSSREHAPQAIAKWGVQALVAVSFAEIFFGNCLAMGIPCLTLAPVDIEALQRAVEADPALEIHLDIDARTVRAGSQSWSAGLADGPRQMLLRGSWDATSGLVEGLDEVRRCAARLPYVNGFAA